MQETAAQTTNTDIRAVRAAQVGFSSKKVRALTAGTWETDHRKPAGRRNVCQRSSAGVRASACLTRAVDAAAGVAADSSCCCGSGHGSAGVALLAERCEHMGYEGCRRFGGCRCRRGCRCHRVVQFAHVERTEKRQRNGSTSKRRRFVSCRTLMSYTCCYARNLVF